MLFHFTYRIVGYVFLSFERFIYSSRCFSAAVAFLYPGYASYKTLSQRPASEEDLERWLMYWSVLGCVVAVEYTTEWLVSWYRHFPTFNDIPHIVANPMPLGSHSTTPSRPSSSYISHYHRPAVPHTSTSITSSHSSIAMSRRSMLRSHR